VSAGGPDLFVVCKNCRAEVSPYVTECPYCGNRLRKRAPKLERGGGPAERLTRRSAAPRLGPMRRGEIPGIRVERRPYATIAFVLMSLAGTVLWRTGLIGLHSFDVSGPLGDEWWRVLTSPLTYISTGYAFVALTAVGVFGWLLERRHGPLAVVLLLALGGAGGVLVAAGTESFPFALGANGAALALLVAWAVPDLQDLRRRREVESDMLGAAAFAVALLLLPAVVVEADALAGATGVVAGALAGLGLARIRPR
jgi:membrane associated rhomboid family serine protease